MKLTNKQVIVLSQLMKDWSIYTERNEHFGMKGQTVYRSLTYYMCDENDKGYHRVHHSIILSLKEKGLIDNGSPYHITELGKEIIQNQ